MTTKYETALEWHRRGCCVIPLSPRTKRPAVKWKPYQTERPREADLRHWFLHRGLNLAVIFGDISKGLGSVDFDDLAGYDAWAAAFPALAASLPTVATRRGRHVYFRATPDSVRRLREGLGKRPDAHGALQRPCGELRLGCGCYSVLPPSSHPSGFEYHWLRPPAWRLPDVDPAVFVEELWPVPSRCDSNPGKWKNS